MKKVLVILAVIVVVAGGLTGWLTYRHHQNSVKQAAAAKEAKAQAQALLNMNTQQLSNLSPDLQKAIQQTQANQKILKSLKFNTLADYETLNAIANQP